MSCTLNKLTTYNVGRVIHDNGTGAYTAQLISPPASCPDSVFVSKKAQIRVVEGSNPELTFDVVQAKPVIMVPRSQYVEEIGSSGFGFGYFFVFAALAMVGIFLVLRNRKTTTVSDSGTYTVPNTGNYRYSGGRGGDATIHGHTVPGGQPNGSQGGQGAVAHTGGGGGGTTVINNNSGGGNDGLVTGLVLGSMLSNNRSERLVEHDTTIIERQAPSSDYSSDSDSSSSSSFSSDSDSSSDFSSDSSSDSSFSSDSDSSSSFSSDSGGSDFGSDSGGGSFSSDS